MKIYKFYAKKIDGESLKGEYTASGPEQLAIELRSKGLYLIKYRLAEQKLRKLIPLICNLRINRVPIKDISYFCKQFSVILSAGISIADALEILQEESLNKDLVKTLNKIQSMIYNGESLSLSMRQIGTIFPEFMINMIAIGEESGKLDSILMQLSIYYEKQYKVKSKAANALIYPSIVFIVSIIVMLFLMTKVVPIFAQNLLSMGGRLPAITIFILAISKFLINKACVIAAIITIIFASYLYVRKKVFFKRKIDKLKFNIPVWNKVYIKLIAAKLASTMSMLMGSGISVVKSLDVVSELINNTLICERLKLSIIDISAGESLSASIRRQNFLPKLLCSMIKIGEETGHVEELLYKVSEVFEEEAYESISKATILIEPVMICLLAGMVAMIIASTMLPMLNVMNVIGG